MYCRPVGQVIFANWLATTSAMSSQSLDFLAGNLKNFDGAKIIAESKDAVGNAFAVRRPGYEARKFFRSIGCDAQNGLVAASSGKGVADYDSHGELRFP
jgi:hypothetical protein